MSLNLFDVNSQQLSQPDSAPDSRPPSVASTPNARRKNAKSPPAPEFDLSAIEEEGNVAKEAQSDADSSKSSDTLMIETELARLSQPAKESTRIVPAKQPTPAPATVSSTATASVDKFAEFSIVLVLSGVSREHRQMVEKLVKRENGIAIGSFSDHCTHVVTKAEAGEDVAQRRCGRTLKVFQGRFQVQLPILYYC